MYEMALSAFAAVRNPSCVHAGPGVSAARGSNLATALASTALGVVLASLLFLLQASQASCAASPGTSPLPNLSAIAPHSPKPHSRKATGCVSNVACSPMNAIAAPGSQIQRQGP